MRRIGLALVVIVLFTVGFAGAAWAAGIQGSVTDRSGGALAGAVIRLLNIETGQERTLVADASGRFDFTMLKPGSYRIAVSVTGFSDQSRTVILRSDSESLKQDFELQLGSVRSDVTVSAARGERDTGVVPVQADVISASELHETAATSTGEALVAAPGVTLVGSVPFQVRPRLRGLDSTRVLVLVDGERLNNARTATDRAGVEVGLVDVGSIDSIEVLGGTGSVLYGTDALSGTVNIITNRPRFSDGPRFTTGFDGYYSSNDNGRRGTVVLGASDAKWAFSLRAGGERFDNYKTGKDFNESSQQFFDNGRIKQADTIDSNFSTAFKKFPDPFNAPFTRTTAEVPNSSMKGTSFNAAGLLKFGESQTLDVKMQKRRAEDVGFPDFANPFFFQGIALPWSELLRYSATYSVTNLTSKFTRLSVTPYYQRQDRLLRNTIPVQFPAPTTGTFFPVNVFRLDILSDTRQQVWTPGVDVQATFLTHPTNVLTAGLTVYQDRSEDERTSSTQMSQIGMVTGAFGQFGPTLTTPTVFATPVPLGPPSVTHPVRVPNATFRDTGLFVHDEWEATPNVRVTGGIRVDGYRVRADNTPGYDIASLIAGAKPEIDPTTLADINGQTISRTAFTGEAGVVVLPDQPVSFFSHYVRSYRHPNLEELLFAGTATAGSIVPNVKVEPETGHNVDLGARFQTPHFTGSLSYFNNAYRNFISTEPVAAVTSQGTTSSISQAINLARVRIRGVELEGNAPVSVGPALLQPYVAFALTRGTVLSGTSPLSGLSLAGKPQDNITPWKSTVGVRASDRRERWWASYNIRSQGEVTRISPLLNESSFLIAQDLLGLAGFTLHRAAVGYDWDRNGERLGLALVFDNLTDEFYREQFQFAPARGRTIAVSFSVRGGK